MSKDEDNNWLGDTQIKEKRQQMWTKNETKMQISTYMGGTSYDLSVDTVAT